MHRRSFLTLLGGAAAAWPLAAKAQQSKVPVVGILSLTSVQDSLALAPARAGLMEAGFIQDQNVSLDIRSAEGRSERLPPLAQELIGRQVNVILALDARAATVAKAATASIPIVFIAANDPVKLGLVASLNRPGGNATGVNVLSIELEGKRRGILREVVPAAETIAVLVNPRNTSAEAQLKDIQDAAHRLDRQVMIFAATNEAEIDDAFKLISQRHIKALSVAADAFLISRRNQIVTLATHYAIPAMYQRREFVQVGGLISYGTDYAPMNRQAGAYVGRVLKGEKPVDLPVMQPTKYELVINLSAAKRLVLDLPPTVLALADEVIE